MPSPNDPPLDEIQWRSPASIAQLGALHSNTILFYFAESPFFERTSNNAVIMSQAMSNPDMYHFIQTREAFEGRLRTMTGLEFMVGEEPAETGPGMGTGVWVVRKQTRRRDGEVSIHASYFIVGENIYMAPTLGDILASRIMSISNSMSKALPEAESVRKWHPELGHAYYLPNSQTRKPTTTTTAAAAAADEPTATSKDDTPMPDTGNSNSNKTAAAAAAADPANDDASLERSAEEAFLVHMRFGGEYIDENPITGRPGEFHLSSTGRKPVPPPQLGVQQGGIGAMNGPSAINAKSSSDDGGARKDGASAREKSKSGSQPKLKRRKSKLSKGSAATTPAAS
ncbi:hypothetical protein GMORB2_2993 [Geosmithia morbida]|uniref:Mediator of RNA polymerase II transcription subunit 6 n=1 Tax=Geosmithia morbida TaxID=1094350 RepID=A0A9P4YPW3_9HYPO|nr:uncharacterized protein GMORB2_2993 [Geosmithia morbida]KAF4120555.1 hypothetical protein GMORB2_2993 [Geosmithia morbida]